MKILSVYLIIFFSILTHAATKNCSEDDSLKNIFSNFSVRNNFPSSGIVVPGYPMNNAVNCNEPIIKKMANAIDIIYKTTQADKTTWPLEQNPWNFLKRRISTFVFENSKSSFACRQNGVSAYVDNQQKDILHLCDISAFTPLMIATTIIHEARHFDGYPHVKCRHGSYIYMDNNSATGSCDETYEELGSYGVSLSFLKTVASMAKDSNNDLNQYQDEAEQQIVMDSAERFNQLPTGWKEIALIQTEDGKLYGFDGKNVIHINKNVDSHGIMASRGNLANFFRADGSVVSLTQKGFTEAPGTYASSFRQNKLFKDRSELIDIFYSTVINCLLFKSGLSCKKPSGEGVDLDLPSTLAARNFIFSDGQLDLGVGLYILTDSGLLKIPDQISDISNLDLNQKMTPFEPLYRGLLDEKVIVLDTQNKLTYTNKDNTESVLIKIPAESKIKKVLSPFYWNF